MRAPWTFLVLLLAVVNGGSPRSDNALDRKMAALERALLLSGVYESRPTPESTPPERKRTQDA
jgi:hypothetical protein